MPQLTWYFHFISHYSYFAFHQLGQLGVEVERSICHRPILFAGLLNHWGQKGPAEIASKRTWTYRWCTWHAAQQGIAFRFPRVHPFNPLAYLRLAIAAGCDVKAIRLIFDRLWTTGVDPADPGLLDELLNSLNVDRARLSAPEVKGA